MLLVNDFHFAVDEHQFEHRDSFVRHELRRYGATNQLGKLLCAAGNVLLSLHNTVTVISAFRLNRDDKLAAMFIDTHVDFVDFDLADSSDRRAQMVLQRKS